jgi:hypothetical protein
MKQEMIKNQTITTLENRKEVFKISLNFKSSFSYVAIIAIICFVIILISFDFCTMISNLKIERPTKHKIAQFPEKINFTNERSNNKRAYVSNIDQRVLNFV